MRYFVGLDLGQAQDPTALVVLEKIREAAPNLRPTRDAAEGARRRAAAEERERRARYECRHLERFPLGTSYPKVVEAVRVLLRTPELGDQATLVLDYTGVGAPVRDMFREAGLDPVAILITGGDTVTYEAGALRVPKRDLVGAVQTGLQSERLKVAASLPLAQTLMRELLAFRVKITASAHDTYGAWREGQHDDLVLALAVALWYAARPQGTVTRGPPSVVLPTWDWG